MTNGKADCNDNVFTTLEEKPEEYTDIEWLEASVDEEEKDTQELVTCNVIECSREPTAASVTKTSPYTREDRLQAIRIHKTHLLILLSCLIKLNVLASDPLVIGCCLSVIPGDCVLSEEDIQGPVEEWKEKCRRLVLFCCHFVGKQRTCDWKSRENYMFWQPLDILQWLQSPRPVACIFAVFVCAIFRGLGMRCRLVQSLIPFSKQPWWTSNKLLGRRSNQSSSNSSVLSPSNLTDSDSCWFAPWTMEWTMPGTHFCNKETIKGVESFPCIYWLEVYSPTLQRWVPIDPFHIWIDEPGLVEDSYKKWKLHPFRQRIVYPVYITAVENVHVNGEQVTIIRDVTLRYICGSIIRKQRLQDTFWSHTLEALSCCDDISSSDNCIASEQREWEYWENKEPIPKSRNRLKGHPKYVLEMHLKKYEAIYPKDRILGYCGQHAVYPRSNVYTLHTRDGWIREMRQVGKDQVAWKRVKTRGKQGETELFGIWQTEPFTPPSAENGIVPKNERGQVDLWSRNHLPRGCVHVRHSNAARIAKRLALDYAPAMIGFDSYGGRSVPIFDGIVVAEEYEEILKDACREDIQHKENEERKERYQQALQLWKACIRHIQSQLKVKQKYGGLFQDELSYEKSLKKRARLVSSSSELSMETTNRTFSSFSNSHSHEFSEEQPCREDSFHRHPLYYKQCSTCGLRITFEKIDSSE